MRSGIPEFAFPERAARALYDAVRYGEWLRQPEGEIPAFDDDTATWERPAGSPAGTPD